MKTTVRVVTKMLYAVSGLGFLAAGASVLLVDTGLLPEAVREVFLKGGRDTLHVLQEFGSLLIFTGLLTFWAVCRYEQSAFFHGALTVFWALLALVHWFDVRDRDPSAVGPLINTIPFAAFALTGLLRWAAGRGNPLPPAAQALK